MPGAPHAPFGPGRLLAVLAVLAQIMLGAALPAHAMAAGLDTGAFPICHAGDPADDAGKAPAGHPVHDGDCALCPVCHVLAAAALPAPPAPPPPRPDRVVAAVAFVPPARAPPGAAVSPAIYPTGPPSLI
jgi:hypothetical protein